MLLKTRKILKKWIRRTLIAVFSCGFICINIYRFNHNIYANYEKAVDYGRVREVKEVINPIMAAVFYAGKNQNKTNLASYISHIDNYRTQNVKMLLVPDKMTAETQQIIEKLYSKIGKHNKISYIILIHNPETDIKAHTQLLQQAFATKEIEAIDITQNISEIEKDIDKFMQENESLAVFTADLNASVTDLALNEALYFAQKNHYKIHMFDKVDTQLAQALENDYAAWFENIDKQQESLLAQQKSNLGTYVRHYGNDIDYYFRKNLQLSPEEDTVWPQKKEKNYRLFDRGYVYARFFTTENKEIFSRAKIGKNKGVIVGIIEIARKAAVKITQPIESYKIYLLTDLEKISSNNNRSLVKHLETDDGVYIQYRGKRALFAADERAQDTATLIDMLRQRAQIADDVAIENLEFYKFKTVEITHEN